MKREREGERDKEIQRKGKTETKRERESEMRGLDRLGAFFCHKLKTFKAEESSVQV